MQKSSQSDHNRGRQGNGGRGHNQTPRNQDQKRPRVEYTARTAATVLSQAFHAINVSQKAQPNRWSKEARTSVNEAKKTASWLLAEGRYNDAVARAMDIIEQFRVRFELPGEQTVASTPAESTEA